MGSSIAVAARTAITGASANGSESSTSIVAAQGSEITSASDSENSDWFGSVARSLLGKEPGVALHYITGFPVSSCEKYAAKTEASRRQPPAYFLRAVLRSDQGEPFFRAFMDGCEAPWWREHQRKLRNAEKVDTAHFE